MIPGALGTSVAMRLADEPERRGPDRPAGARPALLDRPLGDAASENKTPNNDEPRTNNRRHDDGGSPAVSGDRAEPTDGRVGDLPVERRHVLVAAAVGGASLLALGLAGDDGGGPPADGDTPTPTETPFGYGGTATATATAAAIATPTETDEAAETPSDRSPETATPTEAATPTRTTTSGSDGGGAVGGGGGGGSSGGATPTPTPGDYGIQGYGEYGYGGVFP